MTVPLPSVEDHDPVTPAHQDPPRTRIGVQQMCLGTRRAAAVQPLTEVLLALDAPIVITPAEDQRSAGHAHHVAAVERVGAAHQVATP